MAVHKQIYDLSGGQYAWFAFWRCTGQNDCHQPIWSEILKHSKLTFD